MKGYNIFKLNDLETTTRLLRTSPDISFDTANMLNKNNITIITAIKEYQKEAKESQDLLQEVIANLEVGSDKEQEARKQHSEVIKKLNEREFEINITPILKSEFVNLKGDRVYYMGDKPNVVPYIELYFSLLGEVIVE